MIIIVIVFGHKSYVNTHETTNYEGLVWVPCNSTTTNNPSVQSFIFAVENMCTIKSMFFSPLLLLLNAMSMGSSVASHINTAMAIWHYGDDTIRPSCLQHNWKITIFSEGETGRTGNEIFEIKLAAAQRSIQSSVHFFVTCGPLESFALLGFSIAIWRKSDAVWEIRDQNRNVANTSFFFYSNVPGVACRGKWFNSSLHFFKTCLADRIRICLWFFAHLMRVSNSTKYNLIRLCPNFDLLLLHIHFIPVQFFIFIFAHFKFFSLLAISWIFSIAK